MKKVIILMLLFAISLAVQSYACSPAPNYIALFCNINDSSTTFDGTQYGIKILEGQIAFYSYHYEKINLTDDVANFLILYCKEDLSTARQQIGKIIEEYNSKGASFFTNDRTEIIPYNERDIQDDSDLENCYFWKIYRIGDFMVKEGGMRDYCYLGYSGLFTCPFAKKAYSKFIPYLIINHPKKALIYLVKFMIILVVIIIFLVYLYKKKELIFFFKPSFFNVIFTLILGLPTLLIFLGAWRDFFIFITVYYLFACLLRYIYSKIQKYAVNKGSRKS